MKDLKLNLITHDLEIAQYDLALVENTDYIAQKLRIRLWFILGEWFLDITEGVQYYDDIWVKIPDLQKIDAILKATILGTPGVVSLQRYTSSLNRALRKLEIDFTVDTDYGTLTLAEII